jgi:hypothetical protein
MEIYEDNFYLQWYTLEKLDQSPNDFLFYLILSF